MSKIRWEKDRVRQSDRWKGYVGEVVFFAITRWDKDAYEGWKLVCTLPEHAAEDLRPYETVEDAQGWSEEILKMFLKRSGLQIKPPRSAAKPVKEAQEEKTFTDKDGEPLKIGDTVRARRTSFDGPVFLYGLDLVVEKFGRTKIYVSCRREYRDKTWPVSPNTVGLIKES